MGKLATRDNGSNRYFKPQIYESKRRGHSRNFYDGCIYDQQGYKNRYRSNSRDRRGHFGGQSRGRPRYEQNYRGGDFRGNVRTFKNSGRQNSRGEYRGNYRMKIIAEKEIGVCLEKDHFQGILVIREMTVAQAIVDQVLDKE